MTLARNIALGIFLLGTAVLAIYLFVWALIAILIALPFIVFFWRRKFRKFQSNATRKDNVVIVRRLH